MDNLAMTLSPVTFSIQNFKGRRCFFSGIGGSGMSALAVYLAHKGAEVWGSDRDFDRGLNRAVSEALQLHGIRIVPQDGASINRSFSLVVFSAAIEDSHPEALATTRLHLPRMSRAELLAGIINATRSVAVAGTSGKSTTSGLLAFLMTELGLEPGFIGGARVKSFHSATDLGNMLAGKSDYLVAEACESDGSIVLYHPHISVIGNISLDHHDIEKTAELFSILAGNTSERVILNADESGLDFLAPGESRRTYGIRAAADLRAEDVTLNNLSSTFRVNKTMFTLNQPGLHNVYNALACLAVLDQWGITLERVVAPLARFTGIERRFDIHLDQHGCIVVDDYAHNPDKIQALMTAMARLSPQVTYIFQPHGYGPTRIMKDGYIQTFQRMLRKGDRLLLLPIYYAGGTVSQDISSADIVHPLQESGLKADLLEHRSDIMEELGDWKTFVVFGARDESLADYAREIAVELAKKHGPIAP